MKFYNFSDQWFKENRLVHLADGDSKPVNRGAAANNNQEAPLQAANNNVEEPEKKSRHDQKQEKIDSEKQRIKDLEKKVEKSNYTT